MISVRTFFYFAFTYRSFFFRKSGLAMREKVLTS